MKKWQACLLVIAVIGVGGMNLKNWVPLDEKFNKTEARVWSITVSAQPGEEAEESGNKSSEQSEENKNKDEGSAETGASDLNRGVYTTRATAERVCMGECPKGGGDLSCWPARGRTTLVPFDDEYWTHKDYDAYDVAAATGTQIYAPIDGTITYINSGGDAYGCHAILTTNDIPERPGGAQLYFAHMVFGSCDGKVGSSKQITAGELIGLIGKTGNARGVHLHYELRPAIQGQSVLKKYLQLGKYQSNSAAPFCGS